MRLPTKYTHLGYEFLEWAEPQNAYHPGIDFNYGAPNEDLGMPLYPFKGGSVAHTSRRNDGYGNIVVIKHNNNEYSKYAHLDTIECRPGDKVITFDQIATIGKTGTNSPHLHFEIYDSHIAKKSYRYYPVREKKEFVQKHYTNPLEHIMPTKVKVHIIADEVPWIDEHIDCVVDYFLKHTKQQLRLDIDVTHVDEETKLNKDDSVNINWFFQKFRDNFRDKDIAVYCTNNEDWKDKDRGGYQKDDKILGLQTIFMHADKNSESRDFADIDHEFKGRLIHEIIHTLYDIDPNIDSSKSNEDKHIEGGDNTHYWDYTQKKLHKALEEIGYDNLQLNPFNKTHMFNLVKEKKTRHIYAKNEAGKLHYIPNVKMLNQYHGKLWNKDEIKEVKTIDDEDESVPLVLPTK